MSKMFDRYASIVFLLIGIGFMIGSQQISKSAYGSNVGPDIFPFGLGLILVLLSVRLMVETFRYKIDSQAQASFDYKRFLVILISAILYGLLLDSLGYVISTFFFLLIGFQTMERGKWGSSILISALFSLGVYVLFVEVLKGSLPGWPVWLGL